METRENFLRTCHIAKRLNAPERTVRHWLAVQEIEGGFKVGKREWRLGEGDLEKYLRKKRNGS